MAVPPKIAAFLDGKGTPFDVHAHGETFSSVEEAQALGIDAGEVAKVIVVVGGRKGTALFALPASSKTDMHAVREALEDNHARFATEEEMRADFPDYAPGSIPPFADLVGAPLVIDQHIASHERVVFAAGTHTDSISMRVADVRALGPHAVAEVCRVYEDRG